MDGAIPSLNFVFSEQIMQTRTAERWAHSVTREWDTDECSIAADAEPQRTIGLRR
jgi:hypothetical protein